MPVSRSSLRAGSCWSWLSTPRNATWEPRRWCTRSKAGNSFRQGPHHEAKKLRTSGRPRYSASDTWGPPRCTLSSTKGAAAPSFDAPGRCEAGRVTPTSVTRASATTAVARTRKPRRRRMPPGGPSARLSSSGSVGSAVEAVRSTAGPTPRATTGRPPDLILPAVADAASRDGGSSGSGRADREFGYRLLHPLDGDVHLERYLREAHLAVPVDEPEGMGGEGTHGSGQVVDPEGLGDLVRGVGQDGDVDLEAPHHPPRGVEVLDGSGEDVCALRLELRLQLLQLDQLLLTRASAGVFVEVEQYVAPALELGQVDGLPGGGGEDDCRGGCSHPHRVRLLVPGAAAPGTEHYADRHEGDGAGDEERPSPDWAGGRSTALRRHGVMVAGE